MAPIFAATYGQPRRQSQAKSSSVEFLRADVGRRRLGVGRLRSARWWKPACRKIRSQTPEAHRAVLGAFRRAEQGGRPPFCVSTAAAGHSRPQFEPSVHKWLEFHRRLSPILPVQCDTRPSGIPARRLIFRRHIRAAVYVHGRIDLLENWQLAGECHPAWLEPDKQY
jgi:hypothetical protein